MARNTQKNLYTIHYFHNGYRVKSITGCDIEKVRNCQHLAYVNGDTIFYEKER